MTGPAKQFDFERSMLWGDRLRVLLNNEHISPGEIAETLKEKGIFIGTSERNITVPLLSSCLLTPDEFSRLIEKSFTRESGKKYSSSKLKLSTPDDDWKSVLIEDFDKIIESLQPGRDLEFATEPAISAEDNGDIKISYSVRVMDFSQDWIEREMIYPAEILLKASENGIHIEIDRVRTSKDTDRMNENITSALGKFYKARGIVQEEKPDTILFDDLTNSQRVTLFMQLTSSKSSSFTFKEVGDFEIIRDQTAGPLPKDPKIEWMGNRVNKIKIKGNDLGKIFLLNEEEYHQYYFLIKMTALYAFKFGTNVGECSIEYFFSGKSNKSDDYSGTVFNFSIERLSKIEKGGHHLVRKSIIQETQKIRDAAYEFAISSSRDNI